MKECKNICRYCVDDPTNTIFFDPSITSYGRSPGRNRFLNKGCVVCEYWTLTTKSHCCCCGNMYRIRIKGVQEFMTMDYYIQQPPPIILVPELTTK